MVNSLTWLPCPPDRRAPVFLFVFDNPLNFSTSLLGDFKNSKSFDFSQLEANTVGGRVAPK